MPLTNVQRQLLQALAAHRRPDSYIAGAIAINRDGPRYSTDVDIFHDGEPLLDATFTNDIAVLRSAGFDITDIQHRGTGLRSASVGQNGSSTKVEWVADSDYRFFPTLPDAEFGYVLHPADLATNKAAAAAGRRMPRDIFDLVTIDRSYLPLGAVVWAAVDRFPGSTPEEMLNDVRRNGMLKRDEFETLEISEPLDMQDLQRSITDMLARAEEFIGAMPSDAVGVLFLEGDRPVQPDPKALARYHWHRGARRGHWPSSAEIAAAMLERHGIVPAKG